MKQNIIAFSLWKVTTRPTGNDGSNRSVFSWIFASRAVHKVIEGKDSTKAQDVQVSMITQRNV